MASVPGLHADVYFGDMTRPLPDWREAIPDDDLDDDDDTPTADERLAVKAMLGFDPREFAEEEELAESAGAIGTSDFSSLTFQTSPRNRLRNPRNQRNTLEADESGDSVDSEDDFTEACIPNKTGKGNHDDQTGRPCKISGDAKSATRGSAKPAESAKQAPEPAQSAFVGKYTERAAKVVARFESLEIADRLQKIKDETAKIAAEFGPMEDRMKEDMSGKKPLTQDEFRNWVPKYLETKKKLESLKADHDKAVRQVFLDEFAVPKQRRAKINASTKDCDKLTVKAWETAHEFLSQILDKQATGDKDVRIMTRFGRAAYIPLARTIAVSTFDDAGTAVHEFGHLIEDDEIRVHGKVAQFRWKRYNSKDNRNLRKKFPEHGFEKHEIGNPDKMLQTFKGDESGAYYAGKEYPTGNTELISMGVELLFRDPMHFAKVDPEYFDLIMSCLQG